MPVDNNFDNIRKLDSGKYWKIWIFSVITFIFIQLLFFYFNLNGSSGFEISSGYIFLMVLIWNFMGKKDNKLILKYLKLHHIDKYNKIVSNGDESSRSSNFNLMEYVISEDSGTDPKLQTLIYNYRIFIMFQFMNLLFLPLWFFVSVIFS